jgi:hypothetical protein
MKRLLYIGTGMILAGILLFTTSITINDAYSDKRFGGNPQSGITLVVPAKPTSTVYVENNQLNKYLQKGYQVQQVVTIDGRINPSFLMVKY